VASKQSVYKRTEAIINIKPRPPGSFPPHPLIKILPVALNILEPPMAPPPPIALFLLLLPLLPLEVISPGVADDDNFRLPLPDAAAELEANKARPISPSIRLDGLDEEGTVISRHESKEPTRAKVLRM
jgi:hypothetical protein